MQTREAISRAQHRTTVRSAGTSLALGGLLAYVCVAWGCARVRAVRVCAVLTKRYSMPMTPHFFSASFSKAKVDRSRCGVSPQHQRLLL